MVQVARGGGQGEGYGRVVALSLSMLVSMRDDKEDSVL